jgi:phosphoribosylformylglycinamidine synthase
VESIEGLAEACRFFDVPVTGGNVSLYNETLGNPILPTPVVGIVGTMETAIPVGPVFKRPGLAVILLGGVGRATSREMGGTQYAKVIQDSMWGNPPALDMDYEKRVQATVRGLVRSRGVESAHDIGEGGLAVALAECCFGPENIGVDAKLDSDLMPEILLFHEGPSRVIVSTSDPQKVFEAAKDNGIEAVQIGVTLKARVSVHNRNQLFIESRVDELKDIWSHSLEHLLHNPVLVNTNV